MVVQGENLDASVGLLQRVERFPAAREGDAYRQVAAPCGSFFPDWAMLPGVWRQKSFAKWSGCA
jgi:hypothetical protein